MLGWPGTQTLVLDYSCAPTAMVSFFSVLRWAMLRPFVPYENVRISLPIATKEPADGTNWHFVGSVEQVGKL